MFPEYNDTIQRGDQISLDESFEDEQAEIFARCEIADRLIRKGTFTITQGLRAYNLSPREYFAYLLLKNKDYGKKPVADNHIVLEFSKIFLFLMDVGAAHLDKREEKVVADMRELVNG